MIETSKELKNFLSGTACDEVAPTAPEDEGGEQGQNAQTSLPATTQGNQTPSDQQPSRAENTTSGTMPENEPPSASEIQPPSSAEPAGPSEEGPEETEESRPEDTIPPPPEASGEADEDSAEEPLPNMEGRDEISDYMAIVRAGSPTDSGLKKKFLEDSEPVDEPPFTGDNPLLKEDERAMSLGDDKDKDDLEVYLEEFNLFSPLTDFEKSVLEKGVNDEVFEEMREKLKDAETDGNIEKMEMLRKLISTYERVKSKGLRAHYIEIDKDTGEIVRGNYGATRPVEREVPSPPPETPDDGEKDEPRDAGKDVQPEQPSSSTPPQPSPASDNMSKGLDQWLRM